MNTKKIMRYKISEDAFFKAFQLERKEYTIKVKNYGTDLRVQTTGSGEPLLFIHGGPNAGSTWTPLAALLPGFTCILLDRPGCGLSEAISYDNLSEKSLTGMIVSVINSVLDYFQIEKLSFVGSSFGGYWITKYALQEPARINKLIYEGCPAMVEDMEVPSFMKMMTAPFMRWLIPKLPTTKSYSKKIMKEIGHTYSIEHNLIPEIFTNWYVSLCNNTSTMKNDLMLINKIIPRCHMNSEFILHDNEIEKIFQPALWLWGKDDVFGEIEIGKRINKKMKNSHIEIFGNSGHLPWIDRPEEHANNIKEFIWEHKKEYSLFYN